MSCVRALSLAFLFVIASANECSNVFQNGGISERFPGVVAHAIHSITVDDLRLFKPDVTSKNGIPTVNLDLTSDSPILPDAPELEKSCFKTGGMKAVDQVLSHMDNKNYDVKQYSPLERLVHTLHMKEVWNDAKAEYLNFTKFPPTKDLCRCVLDVEANGILKMLRFIALQIREPILMYGKHTTINGNRFGWDGNLYSYSFLAQKDVDDTLLEEQKAIPPLTNEAGWAHWKHLMMTMLPSDNFEFALYLYCALNH